MNRACDYAAGQTVCDKTKFPGTPPAGLCMISGNPTLGRSRYAVFVVKMLIAPQTTQHLQLIRYYPKSDQPHVPPTNDFHPNPRSPINQLPPPPLPSNLPSLLGWPEPRQLRSQEPRTSCPSYLLPHLTLAHSQPTEGFPGNR
jgi:hypothetical protein